MCDNYSILMDTQNFIIFLHNHVYNNTNMIDKLKCELGKRFSDCDILYNDNMKRFEIEKVKEDVDANLEACYAICNFFTDDNVREYVLSELNSLKYADYNVCKHIEDFIERIIHSNHFTSYMYTISHMRSDLVYLNL